MQIFQKIKQIVQVQIITTVPWSG